MIRKLLLPVVAVALLGGCMTSGYSYRQDRGDYYYGTPGTDYRYHDSPYYYGSGYYSRYYGYPGYYRYPYGYSHYPHGYYRDPYRYYRPPVVIRPRPDNDDGHDGGRHDDDRKAPWRDYERLQRERIQRMPVSGPTRIASDSPRPATTVRPVAPQRSSGSSSGSRMESIMKRARQGAVERSRQVEP
ncbi:hypothetical protein [Novilysobacter arseniciresistens]|uniref:hypothetical protein n=1 Tax=Novilysobacter arseniciresistens TaxID=1385522 RepID=UPI000690EB8B|nr:hypothetical protein [Lysobacter arseniciresistens]